MKRARTRLNAEASIPIAQFADLVGDYRLKREEFVRCQLVDERGKCKREHGRGYIAQLIDGTEGCIGHICAADHFSADPRFKALFTAAAARVDLDIEIDRLIERLNVHLQNEALPALLERIESKRGDTFNDVMDIYNSLPKGLSDQLRVRARLKETAIKLNIIYKERVEDARTKEVRDVPRPLETVWHSLAGLTGIRQQPLLGLGKRLADSSSTLSDAIASPDQPIALLRKWVTQLDYVTKADKELDEMRVAVENFRRLENLKWLWLLTRQRVEQIAAARAALELATRRRATDEQGESALAMWGQEIRAAHNGLDFRPL